MDIRVTIKDIAKTAGVSTTTVFKALNDKEKISDDVRKRILDIAKSSGYIPNRNAQALARNKLRIGTIISEYPIEFTKYIMNGCKDAYHYYYDFNIDIDILTYSKTNESQDILKHLKYLVDRKVNGIVIELGQLTEPQKVLLEEATDNGIAVFTLITDTDLIKRHGSVTINATVVGQMAAQYLKMNVKDSSPVVIFTGNKTMQLHQSYISAFSDSAKKLDLRLQGIYETNEIYDIAYALTEQVIKEIPNLGGIYVSSFNSVGVCDCLKKHKLDGKIFVVGQDLYKSLTNCLKDGSLSATIFQNPYLQARRAIDLMVSYLNNSKLKTYDEKIVPQLIMKSNLECYIDDIII